MTVLLCVAWRRRCILRAAVATALRGNAALHTAATHSAVTIGAVVNAGAQSATLHAVHTVLAARESKSKDSIVAECLRFACGVAQVVTSVGGSFVVLCCLTSAFSSNDTACVVVRSRESTFSIHVFVFDGLTGQHLGLVLSLVEVFAATRLRF